MYESPEVVEIGPAARLTLGMGGNVDDNCGCMKQENIIIIDDGAY